MPPTDDSLGEPLDVLSLSIVEEFERAWEASRPDLARFLERHPGRPVQLVFELAAIDLQNRLKRGEAAGVTEYESRFPELSAHAGLSRELRRVAARCSAPVADPEAVAGQGHTGAVASDPGGVDVEVRSGFEEDIGWGSSADALVGTDLGGVSIVRVIADGGMGRVYEGRQAKPSRTVAVKVIKPGLASQELLKRFNFEAQVLGRLQHPGIAHIHTVGTAEVNGLTVPYFVMEYIPNAKSLTRYAEDLKLSTHARLELFRQVCEAVAHGHQKGVIHRDLKPANVLVDSSGQPKVIDFGVARSTDSDLALTTMQTDVGVLIGTLQYMSPEQFDADPHDLDVRLDVYALGVILYELLAGKPPYDVRQRAIYEIAKVVREEEPTPLSKLNKTLRRDVALIAGKCLEKDRARRYSSAAELASDVSRYLAGEPVIAAPPSFWYAVSRVSRKHKAAATAVAAIAASIVAATVGISAFAYRAERARQEAERQQALAMAARDAEAEQRTAADAESSRAKRRLYVANLYKLGTALERPQRGVANEFLADADRAFLDAYGDGLPRPIELNVAAAQVDDAIVVIGRHASGVADFCFSPDGTRLVTAGVAGAARLYDVSTGESLAVLEGHEGPLSCVSFSPDGTRLVTAARDGTAWLWDASAAAPLAVLEGHGGPIACVSFSPDGTRLATASEDSTARLWNTTTGDVEAVLAGHGGAVLSVAFSPDGSRLATASNDDTARLWDASTGESLAVLEGHGTDVTTICFSPDGMHVLTGSGHSDMRLWDASTGKALTVLKGYYGFKKHGTCFSPDGKRLVTNGLGGNLVILDPSTMGFVVLKGHDSWVNAACFSPDGTRLATASQDGTMRLWDASTGKPLAVLMGHEKAVVAVAFSPDGTLLATSSWDKTVRLWIASARAPLTVLAGHHGPSPCVCFSPDGTRLATAGVDVNNSARLWDASTGESLAELNVPADPPLKKPPECFVSFSPDGMRLATASIEGSVRIRDASTGEIRAVLQGHKGPLRSVSFSPDGTRLVTASGGDGTARLWDTSTGATLAVLEGHGPHLMAACFSPDGARLATVGLDFNARLWDGLTGAAITEFKGHEGAIVAVSFSPDGRRLATASFDKTVRLWDASTGESLTVLEVPEEAVQSVCYSPDGTRLVTASFDGAAQLWDASTGESLAVLKGHQLPVTSIQFSPDGTRVATAGKDGTVQLWDVSTGDSLAVLKGHAPGELAACFSPDGKRLATASSDGTTRLWGFSNADIHRNRLVSGERRKRLAPLVAEWFAGDLASVMAKLAAAKATLPPDDWREASNLVLERANSAQRPPDDAAVAGVVQGETLKVLSRSAGETRTQDMTHFKAARWSGDAQFYWLYAQPGGRLLLEVPVTVWGRHEVVAVCTKAPDYGVVTLSWNGSQATAPLDLYDNDDVKITPEVSLGTFDLAPGKATLAVEIVGENPAAIKHWMFGLDYIRFVPAKTDP